MISTDFQMQMEQAKVASLKRQDEVEVARTETIVAQKRLEKAETDLAQLEVKLADAKNGRRAGGKAGLERIAAGRGLCRSGPMMGRIVSGPRRFEPLRPAQTNGALTTRPFCGAPLRPRQSTGGVATLSDAPDSRPARAS